MLRFLGLFIVLFGLSAAVDAQNQRVLLIHSYHSGMPWTDFQQKGFAETLRNSGRNVDLFVEYLDSLRYREQKSAMRENLRRTLLSKFKNHPPDVIAVTDNNAMDFILDERPQLAPGVPIVFCGINGLSTDIRSRYKNLTGVAEEASFKETLDIMEQLLPGRLVLVLGEGEESATFRGNFASLRKANEQRRSPAQLDVFNDPVLSHIEARLRRAGPDTVVFILNRPVDDRGETIDSATAVRAISAASKQPVFSVWDYMFGYGIVGGKLTSGEAHGQTAARQVIRILNGESADSIPIEWESPNRYFFDYAQLRRFGLQDMPLPEGSIVINHPVSFYELHRDKVLVVTGVFTLLLLLGARLLVMNRSLRESRNLLDNIVNNIPVMVFLKRASDLSFVLFNRAGEALLGRSRDELLGQSDYDLFPKVQADFFTGKDREVLKRKDVLDVAEEPIETANGPRILHTRKLALRNKEGQPMYLLGISEDITERKQAQHQVALLSFALNGVHEAAFLIDEKARFHFVNEEACRILGYSREELLAAGVEDVDPDWPAARWPDHWRELAEKKSLTFDGRHRAKDGRIIPVEINANLIEYEQQSYNLALVRDITERKQAEEELRKNKDQLEETVQRRTAELQLARDAAEAANKAKSVFLANMSHELRTPLNAILGFSHLVRRDPELPASHRENLEIINRSGEHLLALINDVLEIAKIEAGRLQLEIAPFDFGSMVRDVADMMELRAREKALRLLLEMRSDVPRYLKGDEARLRQILINLVGNAVKFTRQGGVTIRLGMHRNDRLLLLIEVEDSGPGISAEDQQRLFRPFVQLAEGGEQKGTGLGLTITKQFVELMGGVISVESTLGKGSLFRAEIPVEPAETTEVVQPKGVTHGNVTGLAPGQPRYRILIAEDQLENQLLLTRLMSDIDLETKLAENGERCLSLFQEWHPDLIWMDRRMPVMDGEEAARRIRQLPGGDKVKIIAVTASAFMEEQQEMLAAGMDDFVRKPYRFDEIYDCLARQLGVRYQYEDVPEVKEAAVDLTPAMLAVLPEALRRELREALESLETEAISAVIRQVGIYDPKLEKALARLALVFDYQGILKALGEVKT